MEKYRLYPCKMCGVCCRYVRLIKSMMKFDRGDGACIHLRDDNKCDIYYHRPHICNGKWVYEHLYSNMTVSDFHQMTADFCKKIQEAGSVEKLFKNK